MVKLKRQRYGLLILRGIVNFADANGRTLVGRFNKQRQTELSFELIKGEAVAVAARQGNERRNGKPGVAQQALGHVFIHAGGGT